MAEQATRIKDQSSGDYIATRDANEQDAEAHNRVIQLVDLASRQLLSPAIIRGAALVTAADGVDLEDLPADLTGNLIEVGDRKTLIVNPEHSANDGGIGITPLIYNTAGDNVLAIGERKVSDISDLFCRESAESNVWTKVALKHELQSRINTLAEFNNKLYGGTSGEGRLFEWNGTDAWVQKAPELDGQDIYSLAVFNDKLYGGTDGGRLFEWNGTDAWVQKAAQLNGQTYIYSLAVFNNKLYGGTNTSGRLFEWNGTDAWVQKAAQLNGQTDIYSLAVFNNKLYGGASWDGLLFEWNGTDAWVQKAAQLNGQLAIWSLVVFDNKLYGGTYGEGRLFEWNGTDAWVQKAAQLELQESIRSLAVLNGKLYGGTEKGFGGSRLFEWNGTDAWIQKAPQLESENAICSLVEFNSKLYGGTDLNGYLYEWSPASNVYSSPQLQWDVSGAPKIGLHITSIKGTENGVALKGGVV